MANRTYFGFTDREFKSTNISDVKICSSGVNWSLTPLHVLLCSLDYKRYVNRSKDYVVVTPSSSAEKVFRYLLEISSSDKELYSQLEKCFNIFKSAAKRYKSSVGIFSEIAVLDGIDYIDKSLKRAHSILEASVDLTGKSGSVIRKALSILSRPDVLKGPEDLYRITEEMVGVYEEPEDFTGDWFTIR